MTETATEKPSKTFRSKPVNGYRQNELYRRYRQIVLEMSGAELTELSGKPQDSSLERSIVEDFAKLQQRYTT